MKLVKMAAVAGLAGTATATNGDLSGYGSECAPTVYIPVTTTVTAFPIGSSSTSIQSSVVAPTSTGPSSVPFSYSVPALLSTSTFTSTLTLTDFSTTDVTVITSVTTMSIPGASTSSAASTFATYTNSTSAVVSPASVTLSTTLETSVYTTTVTSSAASLTSSTSSSTNFLTSTTDSGTTSSLSSVGAVNTSSAFSGTLFTVSPSLTSHISTLTITGYGTYPHRPGHNHTSSATSEVSPVSVSVSVTQSSTGVTNSTLSPVGSSTTPTFVPASLSSTSDNCSTSTSATGTSVIGATTAPAQNITSAPTSSSVATGFTTVVSPSISAYNTSTSASTPAQSATTATNTTTGAGSPTPSVCGEHGDFMLTWDDEPDFQPSGSPPITDAPPVFGPYHHFWFSLGFVYGPPPALPYTPISAPHLAVFLPNETGPSNDGNAVSLRAGELGDGIRASESAFWFNAYSAYLGCDDGGPEGCTMEISGYTYNTFVQAEVLTFQHNVSIPPCPGFVDCQLELVEFPDYTGLSGLQMNALVDGAERIWFMDNLSLGWYNNTCAAGLQRQSSE